MMRFMSTVVALQYDLLCILICRALISTAMRVQSAIFGVKIICKKLIRNIMIKCLAQKGVFMSENKYNPIPVDTSDVVLPEELLSLTEKIAENVHDVWAAGRIAEGWTYGPVKDIEKKTTPQMVAYNELPEDEKEYDRNTALETLKLIVKLGYEIRKSY